jgi:hypothetical protein
MSVYVDEPKWPFRGQLYCHMLADTTTELQAMASRIGLKAAWIQKPGTPMEHYDLAPSVRAKAVAAGAQEITWRQCGEMMRQRKAGHR